MTLEITPEERQLIIDCMREKYTKLGEDRTRFEKETLFAEAKACTLQRRSLISLFTKISTL